jgi:hypothetical protein
VEQYLEVLEAMTAPTVDRQTSLPERAGPKGLLPNTWLERTLRVSYTDCHGSRQEGAQSRDYGYLLERTLTERALSSEASG